MSENKEHNLIDRAVDFFKRQLTLLQEIYLKYFNKLLKKYEVESPAELKEEKRAIFFQEVEKAWKKECEQRKIEIEEELQERKNKLDDEAKATQAPILPIDLETEASSVPEDTEEEKTNGQEPENKEEQKENKADEPTCEYSAPSEPENDKLKSKPTDTNEKENELPSLTDKKNTPSRGTQGKGHTRRKGTSNGSPKQRPQDSSSNDNVVETDVLRIDSLVNPEQSDDLRIGYHPNSFFVQTDHYTYPVVKMPKEGALLKLPRKGRAMGKGYKENDFHEAILTHIPEVEVDIDLHMAIPFYNRPYEPDIVLINKALNLYIDIEIDEPYDGYYRFPTHNFNQDEKTDEIVKKDDTRDLFFTESGWIIIRFTERQVHLQKAECITYIKDVINSIVNYRLVESSSCVSEPQWNQQQAVRWAKEHYREKYLDIERFGKQIPTSKIVVDINDTEAIEDNINRTKKFESTNAQNNIAFEDEAHVYHHAKDETGNAEYISVTTLIERFFPFDTERYIQNKAKIEERSEKEVLDEFLKMRDEASEKGTYMHEQIENFLNGNPYNTITNKFDISKEFDMFKIFYQQIVVAKGFEFVEAEKKVLLDDYNVAGTIDALFKKPNKDEYLIVDWKRSKKLIIDGHPKKYGHGYALSELNYLDNSSYYKYALQQNIYKYMLEKKHGLRVSSMNLIVLHEKFDKYHRVNLVNMGKEVSIILNSINHKI
ncbi:hypothetical protein [Ancylomarina sp. 16SWW S1-10-2]|uniref:hypothetical protein n=1 Tax=Ancylomarina sp. 16SWW S1-10-2 TaxID=2499681 RepID=UPI0012ADECED|nr:hypothetical protein [Ancylomarina sp. 16SWW S1-10-2]MRT92073.1 hypothetical protein [Ancylomarina sp. 16SWW S1-10-2]